MDRRGRRANRLPIGRDDDGAILASWLLAVGIASTHSVENGALSSNKNKKVRVLDAAALTNVAGGVGRREIDNLCGQVASQTFGVNPMSQSHDSGLSSKNLERRNGPLAAREEGNWRGGYHIHAESRCPLTAKLLL